MAFRLCILLVAASACAASHDDRRERSTSETLRRLQYENKASYGNKPNYGNKPSSTNSDKPDYSGEKYGNKPSYGGGQYGTKPSYGQQQGTSMEKSKGQKPPMHPAEKSEEEKQGQGRKSPMRSESKSGEEKQGRGQKPNMNQWQRGEGKTEEEKQGLLQGQKPPMKEGERGEGKDVERKQGQGQKPPMKESKQGEGKSEEKRQGRGSQEQKPIKEKQGEEEKPPVQDVELGEGKSEEEKEGREAQGQKPPVKEAVVSKPPVYVEKKKEPEQPVLPEVLGSISFNVAADAQELASDSSMHNVFQSTIAKIAGVDTQEVRILDISGFRRLAASSLRFNGLRRLQQAVRVNFAIVTDTEEEARVAATALESAPPEAVKAELQHEMAAQGKSYTVEKVQKIETEPVEATYSGNAAHHDAFGERLETFGNMTLIATIACPTIFCCGVALAGINWLTSRKKSKAKVRVAVAPVPERTKFGSDKSSVVVVKAAKHAEVKVFKEAPEPIKRSDSVCSETSTDVGSIASSRPSTGSSVQSVPTNSRVSTRNSVSSLQSASHTSAKVAMQSPAAPRVNMWTEGKPRGTINPPFQASPQTQRPITSTNSPTHWGGNSPPLTPQQRSPALGTSSRASSAAGVRGRPGQPAVGASSRASSATGVRGEPLGRPGQALVGSPARQRPAPQGPRRSSCSGAHARQSR